MPKVPKLPKMPKIKFQLPAISSCQWSVVVVSCQKKGPAFPQRTTDDKQRTNI